LRETWQNEFLSTGPHVQPDRAASSRTGPRPAGQGLVQPDQPTSQQDWTSKPVERNMAKRISLNRLARPAGQGRVQLDRAASSRTGPCPAGQGRVQPDKAASSRTRPRPAGQGRVQPDKAASSRTGACPTGQGRVQPDRAVSSRTGQRPAGQGRVQPDRAASSRTRPCPAGQGRVQPDRAASSRKGPRPAGQGRVQPPGYMRGGPEVIRIIGGEVGDYLACLRPLCYRFRRYAGAGCSHSRSQGEIRSAVYAAAECGKRSICSGSVRCESRASHLARSAVHLRIFSAMERF
jgi:hypothetical protein